MNKARPNAIWRIPSTQRGAVLAVTLALLTTLTLLALAAGQSIRAHARTLSTLNERQQLFELTESALREGEMEVLNLEESDLRSHSDRSARIDWAAVAAQASWWQSHGSSFTGSVSKEGSAYYVVEPYEFSPNRTYFRVTAASMHEGKLIAVLQSIYAIDAVDGRSPAVPCDSSSVHCQHARASRQSWIQLR